MKMRGTTSLKPPLTSLDVFPTIKQEGRSSWAAAVKTPRGYDGRVRAQENPRRAVICPI